MSELPRGWVEAEVGSVAFIRNETVDPAEIQEMPFLGLEDIEPRSGLILSQSSTAGLKSKVVLFDKGDLLFGRLRPYLQKVLVSSTSGAASAEFIVLQQHENCDTNLLCALMKSPSFLAYTAQESAGDRPRVSYKSISKFRFPLPPLDEQKRIVAKLDALSTRSARARTNLTRIDTLVKRYKQAVLSKAFASCQGELHPLEALIAENSPIRYGVLQPGKIKDVGVQMIRVCDLTDGQVAWEKLRRIDPEIDAEFSKARVANGDVLLSVVGTIGRIALVSGLSEPTNIARAVVRLRPDKKQVLPEWLAIRLQASDCQFTFTSDAREVARKTLNVSKIRSVPVVVPPVAEQKEIVRRIERAFRKIDRLAAETKRALELTGKLDEAVLAKAFRGELVPQDPSDEPASILLDRIKADRAA